MPGPRGSAEPRGAPGWEISHVVETGSTNADLVRRALLGARDRTVLVADVQRRGRGRLGRDWIAPPGTALLFSMLLRSSGIPPHRLGWIGAIVGLAVTGAIREITGLAASLKWPNDILIDGRKVAGILAERAGEALVVGAGINVTLSTAQLPRPDATSLALAGAPLDRCDRDVLLHAILRHFDPLLNAWRDAGGDVDGSGLRAAYLARSATLGRRVTVHLPDGNHVTGTAIDVAADGAIVIDVDGSVRRFTAGDVEHLRPA